MTRRWIHVTRRRLAPRVTIGTLAVVVASCALLVPGAAYANTNRVELVIAATNLRADVMWASTQDAQNVFLWPNNASASQEFDLINMGSGFFQIRARHSGKCLMLDKNQGKVGNGTRIAQYPCPGAGYQSAQWSFQDMNGNCEADALCADTGRRVIRNRYTRSAWTRTTHPASARTESGAAVVDVHLVAQRLERRQPDLEAHRPAHQAAHLPAPLVNACRRSDTAGAIQAPAGGAAASARAFYRSR